MRTRDPRKYTAAARWQSSGQLGVFGLLHGTSYAEEIPGRKFIEHEATNYETGINYFRYYPSHSYIELLLVDDGWATACPHYFIRACPNR